VKRLFVVVVSIAALGATAQLSSSAAAVRVRPPGFTTWTETFVDVSRPTVPSTGPASPSRTLVTTIYRPNGHGPFPVVVFSHGLAGYPEKFTKLFAAWASAGFVVVAPTFPLTNGHVPRRDAGDYVHQPADVSFVLDRVLALDKQRGNRLYHAINDHRIGAGGLSLGGLTTYLLAYDPCCRDARLDAVAVLDGIRPNVALDGHAPLLIAHSDTDPVIPYSTARAAYDGAAAPVWLVTFHGASHASQWEDDVTPYDAIAERVTTDFWTGTLTRKHKSLTQLERDATVPGLSSIEAKTARHRPAVR
jgi:dienelactone hydrolase